MKNFTKLLACSWILLGLLTAVPAIASANGNLTIVVKNQNPTNENKNWFIYEKKAGEAIDDVAVVKNLGDKPLTAHVYAVDASSNSSGSFILKLEDETRSDIGKWTKMNANDTITIPAQQSVDFPFHIQIPENATPGQYFGGIVLEEANNAPEAVPVAAASATGPQICCTNILVKTRIGLRIYLTIPGMIKDSMEWSGFTTLQKNKITNFQFNLTNTGNVALEPTADVEIYDGMGNRVDRFQKSLGESLPGTTISPIISWDKQPIFGGFKAVATVNYRIKSESIDQSFHGSTGLAPKTTTFSVIPWNIIWMIVLCALAAGVTYIFYINNQHLLAQNWEYYEVKTDENIMNIAENHNISWKKIAQVNKLKAPYLLTEKQKIRVPKKTHRAQSSLFDGNKNA